MKNGAPSTEVIIPTGISVGAAMVLAAVSHSIRNVAPPKKEYGRRLLLLEPLKSLTEWGILSPTNPIIPLTETADATKNEDITIYGTGNQTRSFCYIDDLTDGLIKLMNNSDDFIGPINLGNDSEYSILDIAKIILDKINTKSKIVFKELPNDDPKMRKPDITKAKLILNWEPKIDLNLLSHSSSRPKAKA